MSRWSGRHLEYVRDDDAGLRWIADVGDGNTRTAWQLRVHLLRQTRSVSLSGAPGARAMSEREGRTLCGQCGPSIAVDEDGCCAACGADATGKYIDAAFDWIERALRERDEARALVDTAMATVPKSMERMMGEIGSDETRLISDTGTVILQRVHGTYEPGGEHPEWWLGLSQERNTDDYPAINIRLTERQRIALMRELADDDMPEVAAALMRVDVRDE